MTNSTKTRESRYIAQYDQGIATFCRLFTHWMDSNRWTHPVLIELVRCCLDGAGWIHSSQISALRQGRLRNPGPRGFIAIAELNKALHVYKTTKKLIPNTSTDLPYLQAFTITENGVPPEPGWWFEVFCGFRVPTDVDLNVTFRTELAAAEFSRSYARLVRELMARKGYDIFDSLDRVVREFYPAGDSARVERLKGVLLNKTVWSIEEANLELPALTAVTSDLGGPQCQEELISTIG